MLKEGKIVPKLTLGPFRTLANLVLTIYNTVILVRSVIKFLDRNFLFIEKVSSLFR